MDIGRYANEVVEYVNQGILSIAELETKSIERYASVTGENYTTDEKVYEALKDFVIPTYSRFVDNLRNITTEIEDIRRVHGIYIRAAESILEGFKTKMLGIENNDDGIIIQGNKKIEQGSLEIQKWRAELDKLFVEQGVALK
ncbi:hypothetical protein ACFL6W_01215 [Thermodesulfobacteriota bacterium]